MYINLDTSTVYTNYFSNSQTKVLPEKSLSIARKTPEWFPGELFRALAPPRYLINLLKSHRLTTGDFERLYSLNVLSRLDPEEIYLIIKGKALYCWESEGFCHRHVVRFWLENTLGVSTEELSKKYHKNHTQKQQKLF